MKHLFYKQLLTSELKRTLDHVIVSQFPNNKGGPPKKLLLN